MAVIRLHETTYGGGKAYVARADHHPTPYYLIWMESRDGHFSLYSSSYALLERFDTAKTINEAIEKMEGELFRWVKDHKTRDKIDKNITRDLS